MITEEAKDGEYLYKQAGEPRIWRATLNDDGVEKDIIEFEAWVSTEAIDRDGEVIRVEGWRKQSLQKPKFQLFHDYDELVIGKPYWVKSQEEGKIKGLKAKGRFGPQLHGLAVGELYLLGDMDSFSVGFRWFKRIFDSEADGQKKPFYEYIDQELYEFSAVNVPANPEATIAMSKMITDAGDVKDMMAIIKGFAKAKDFKKLDRDAYIIKNDVQESIDKLRARLDKLEKNTEHNATEFEGDEIDIEDIDPEEIEIDDPLAIEGDSSELLVDVDEAEPLEIEI